MKITFIYRNNFCFGRIEERDIIAPTIHDAIIIINDMFCGFCDIVDIITE